MAQVPGKREEHRQFGELTSTERRAVVRAVNRGQPVENRRHAPLAVAVARRQLRFWKWAWLLGPIVGFAQLPLTTPIGALINAFVGTAMLLAMAWFWRRRARASEAANLALMDRRSTGRPAPRDNSRSQGQSKGQGKAVPAESRKRSHMPSRAERRREAAAARETTPTEAEETTADTESDDRPRYRPPAPRGKKRR